MGEMSDVEPAKPDVVVATLSARDGSGCHGDSGPAKREALVSCALGSARVAEEHACERTDVAHRARKVSLGLVRGRHPRSLLGRSWVAANGHRPSGTVQLRVQLLPIDS